MAERCENCRKLEECLYWTQFQARKFHFYKVLTGDFTRPLSIPRKFTKHFEEETSEVAHLKGPSGYVWHVGLKKTADDLLFQNGWKEFVEQCSLEPGNLLVFRYDGKLCFNVQIFDGSGCERDYSYFSGNCQKVITNEGHRLKEKTTEDVEILHFSSPHEVCSQTSFRKLDRDHPPTTQLSFLAKSVPSNEKEVTKNHKTELKRTKKKKKSEAIVIDLENPNPKPVQQIQSSKTTEHPQGQEMSIVSPSGENRWCPRWFMSNRRPVTDEEKARAVEAARAFKSTNPSFTIVLRASYVYKKCPLAIPTNFAKIYLPRENQDMSLRDSSSGKTWSVMYTYKSYAGLGRGWVTFAWENNLEEGDVCVFELVKQAPTIVMDVVIFRVVEALVPLTNPNGDATPGTRRRRRPEKGPSEVTS